MNRRSSSNQVGSIASIVAEKYGSVLKLMGLLLVGLWLSLTLYATNNIYRQVIDRMYSWILVNKERIAEALFLENYASLGIRLSHVSALSDSLSEYEMSVYDANRHIFVGRDLPLADHHIRGFDYRISQLEVSYYDSLNFAGKVVGYLSIRGRPKTTVVIAIFVVISSLCLIIFLSLQRLLRSFRFTLERRIISPVVILRQKMQQFDIGQADAQELPENRAALEISELYEGYRQLMRNVRDYAEIEVKRMEAETAFRIAAQTAHDIRSPLAALRTASAGITSLPEAQRNLIRTAINRINEIAENLIESNQLHHQLGPLTATPTAKVSNEPLIALVDTIVSEKTVQLQDNTRLTLTFHSGPGTYGLFSNINAREFRRLLSNLLNNALEAVPPQAMGKLTVTLTARPHEAVIAISDNGKGIPPEVIPKITEEGFSHDKQGGSGLGLYHMKTCLEAWKGNYTIKSKTGLGTTVTVTLPRTDPPAWFVSKILLHRQQTVVIVDDDNSIHELWQSRLQNLQTASHSLTLIHQFKPRELVTWHQSQLEIPRNTLYLVDFEYQKESVSGIELIDSLKIIHQAILVTAQHEESKVRSESIRSGLRILPKALASLVPLEFTN